MRRPAKYQETRVGQCSLTEPAKRTHKPDLAALRVKEVRALLAARWGREVPLLDDPDTRSQMVAFADLAAAAQRRARPGRDTSPAAVERRIVDLLLLVCPELRTEARDIASAALDLRRKWSPEDLGEALGLSVDERERLGITQLRPAGFGGAAWEEFRRERERLRGERRRREAGARPKAEIAAAAEALRAEIAAFQRATGKSRRTFFLWRKAGRDWKADIAPSRPDQVSTNAPDAAVQSGGAPSGAPRDPAAALAEIVIRSTGHRPSAVMVEGDEAIVVLDPTRTREGQVLAPHLAETLRQLGIRASAAFDGRAAISLTLGRAAAA